MLTHAMILAAGYGKRLRPLTDHMPKPMVEVAGRTLIDRAIDRVEEYGIKRVVVNTAYKADMLEAHLAKRTTPSIYFSREQTALETGGGIAKALPGLGNGPFVSMNSDVIMLSGAEHFLARLERHWRDDLLALLLVQPVGQARGYTGNGDFVLTDAGAFRRRRDGEETAPYVFTGIQILSPRLFEDVPEGPFSLNLLYDRHVGEEGWFRGMRALVHDGAWLHIGDLEGLADATAYMGAQAA